MIMTAPDLIETLSADLTVHHIMVLTAIKTDEELRSIVKAYSRGEVSYETVREAVGGQF